jgi:hypothetical protein
MSMDNLEKYIKENRAAFDDKKAPEDAWHNINDRLDNNETRVVPISTYLWRAAAIVLFAAVVWLLADQPDGKNTITGANGFFNENEIAFNDVEAFYIKEIETKQSLIIQFVADNPELDRDLLGEIDQLDSTYQMLKSTAEVGQSEKIIDAMVLNLQMRIDILNQQLEVLEKIKSIKENEKISI